MVLRRDTARPRTPNQFGIVLFPNLPLIGQRFEGGRFYRLLCLQEVAPFSGG